MSAATGGPWCLSPNGTYIRKTLHGYNIATLNEALEPDEVKANALLISAAPELLEVMEDFVLDHDNGLGPSVDRLRAAIAKARGES